MCEQTLTLHARKSTFCVPSHALITLYRGWINLAAFYRLISLNLRPLASREDDTVVEFIIIPHFSEFSFE